MPRLPRRRARLALGSLVWLAWLAAPAWGATIQDIAGAYEGSWHNTTFDSTGPAHVRIEIAGAAIDIHIDMDGNVFGGLDPAEVVLSGTISSGDAQFDPTVATYGHIVGSITGSSGAFNVDLDMINPAILSANGTGTVAGGSMDVTYTVQIMGFGQAAGTLNATLPEPEGGMGGAAALVALALASFATPRRARSRCRASG
jgi:hypothetical protein